MHFNVYFSAVKTINRIQNKSFGLYIYYVCKYQYFTYKSNIFLNIYKCVSIYIYST